MTHRIHLVRPCLQSYHGNKKTSKLLFNKREEKFDHLLHLDNLLAKIMFTSTATYINKVNNENSKTLLTVVMVAKTDISEGVEVEAKHRNIASF